MAGEEGAGGVKKNAIDEANKQSANIYAPEVKAMNDMEFTLNDARNWNEWRFEHLSFRGDTLGAMIEP